jgi:polygalacturonase
MQALVLTALLLLSPVAFSYSHSPRSGTCIVSSKYATSKGKDDDSPAVLAAFKTCAKDSTIIFSDGVNYNIFTPVQARLHNVAIHVKGNIHLPQNISLVQSIVKNGISTRWITLSGPQIDYIGTPDIHNGWINSYGQPWWDANAAAKGTGLPNRPHLISFNTTNGSLQYFKSRKPIGWNVSLSGKNVTVSNPVIDAVSNSSSFPFNTNAFGVTGTDIRIFNMSVFNGDDAVAVQPGAHNVFVQGGTIGYQTHGLSIGSLSGSEKSPVSVSNIWFNDITVKDSIYAARFKSWVGGYGLAKNITWSNIRVENVSMPIFVTQTYFNQGTSVSKRPNNSSVMMEDFTWSNFTGTINTIKPGDGSCVGSPCWYNVGLPNLKHTEAVIIECSTEQSCKNFVLKEIKLRPQSSEPASVICMNAKAELNPKLGFECRNGTFTLPGAD